MVLHKTTPIPQTPYFANYETREPPKPVRKDKTQFLIFRVLAILYTVVAVYYFLWRFHTLTYGDWFAILFLAAEFLLFIGSLFRVLNYWSFKDPRPEIPIHMLSEMDELSIGKQDRPISIAIFIATHNEEVELLEYTIHDTRKMEYPYGDVIRNIYLLDDGQRAQELKPLCDRFGINYLGKPDHIGYKAGNLNYGFVNSAQEDIVVILDADSRPFSTLLAHTTGYFRNPNVTFVQTPQWYYDTTLPIKPSVFLERSLGLFGKKLGRVLEWCTFGKIYFQKDLFASSSAFFYEGILRNKNVHKTVFSCGAGSLYRRSSLEAYAVGMPDHGVPFKHHISEDLFNSMLMLDFFSGKRYGVYHHLIESKMLSPQDLDSWVKQQSRYAQGSIDIGVNHNPIKMKGLGLLQKLHFVAIVYCYFTPMLSYIFFVAPIYFFVNQKHPVPAFGSEYLLLFGVFQFINVILFACANQGISTKRSDQKYWASFWYVTQSWLRVLLGKKLLFHVTPKFKSTNNPLKHIVPHLLVCSTLLGSVIWYFLSGKCTLEAFFYLFWVFYFWFQLNQFIRAGLAKTEF
jgi:cellulose synthase (UDP-forming)